MGTATVVEDKGFGLYSVRLNYNMTAVDAEIAALEKAETEYLAELNRLFRALDDVRRAKHEAGEGLYAVIKQWKDLLIDKANEEPPPITPPTPDDPATGEPWDDPDRAQDTELLDAINTRRVLAGLDPLDRDEDLDQGILAHLRLLATTGAVTHRDGEWTAEDRARYFGYQYDRAIGVGQVQAFGAPTAEAAVEQWENAGDLAYLLSEDYTDCGVAYVYAPRNAYGHLWGAVFSTLGPPPSEVEEPEDDPATKAARDEAAKLEKIKLPTIETFEPNKLGEVAAIFAKAALQVRAAEDAVQELQGQAIERRQRLAVLAILKSRANTPIDAWACRPPDFLAAGDVTDTAEIPGFYLDDPQTVTRTFTVEIGSPEATRTYEERPINLLPNGLWQTGKLTPVDGMTPAEAFFAAAIEPGWARWKPIWRYGTITVKEGDTCSVTLEARDMREIRDAQEVLILDTEANRSLIRVPIVYPPCNGDVFYVGDEVLVLFEGYSRETPKVIGFKYAPRVCPQGRVSWR